MTHQKKLGQYFTISESLQTFVFEKVKHKKELLLEPSFGAGHLLKKFKEYEDDYPMVCYEIDSTIKPVISFNSHQTCIYGDFTTQDIKQKFKTIIGNPPYVKQKKGNLYLKFIQQCYDCLTDNGELIFIVPSDFLKLTSASSLIKSMTSHGSFTDILFPHDETLFEDANIDVVVFRYEKGLLTNKTVVNGVDKICNVKNGIITFSEQSIHGISLNELFDVYVGMVSGKDDVFKIEFGNIEVLTDKDKTEPFLFIDSFPTKCKKINDYLESNKQVLLSRKIKKFNDKNWFEWGAPRNLSSILEKWGKSCIYIRTMTRKAEVAFEGTVQYFGGTLLCLVPKKKQSLKKIVSYLNSDSFKNDYTYSGRFKIGHKQVSNAVIPS
jgi:adenine-specific DNA-methyltransferase